MNFHKSKFSGGIAKMWILPLQYYQGLTFDPASGLFQAIGIKNSLIEVPFSIDSARYRVRSKKNAYETSISGFIPGVDNNNWQSSINLEANPFLVIIQDSNKNYLIFGDYHNFFLYTPDIDSNEDFSEATGINFSISRTMMGVPKFLKGVFLNTPPVAFNVFVSGDIVSGGTIVGNYTFIDADGDAEDGSAYTWYLSDDVTGSNEQPVSGETSQSLTLTEAMLGKFIRFGIIPHDGIEFGDEVFSSRKEVVEDIDHEPVALGVSVSGDFVSKGVVYGSYTYTDEDADAEYNSIRRFFVQDDEAGRNRMLIHESIGVDTDNIFTQLDFYADKYLVFSVIPNNAKQSGVEVFSIPVLISATWHNYDLTTADMGKYYSDLTNIDLTYCKNESVINPESRNEFILTKTADTDVFNFQLRGDLNLYANRVRFDVGLNFKIHQALGSSICFDNLKNVYDLQYYPDDVFAQCPYVEAGVQYGTDTNLRETTSLLTNPNWPKPTVSLVPGDFSTYPQPVPVLNEATQEYENHVGVNYHVEIVNPYPAASMGRVFAKIYANGSHHIGRSHMRFSISNVQFYR